MWWSSRPLAMGKLTEAQAYAFDDLADNQRVVSVWQRVL